MPKYETIPIVLETDEEAPTTNTRSDGGLRTKVSIRVIIGGVAALSMLLAVIFMKSSAGASATATSVPLLGSTNANSAPCTFDECYASNCNHKVAPFTCLRHNGGPHGGCSPTPWTAFTCTTQCDLSGCDDLDIPDDTESCDTPCDESVCVGERLCDHDAPFQCTSGSAAFGCSVGKFEWTIRTNENTCNSCCNAKSCKE
mmetsp:Transcript_21383/g.46431  ORF Transcript_21383/g.46431 Transcript_21383/m.46431 type:complete len:200 (-) Transcript_21383:161-760(-)|eukprot:CAMPEP_0172310128 /NCGR_PEP_ID=MMETSP1058-20130122/11308_1 /TAXON_ID=83371 /ORGANISM="Detonula confervacea, Strain CCMP 353" /LENGTH=199 /DNA_ID=CAMNT_0013022893 /DNA_START=96 /DNA_END=695 /DNA_ORIENTATION=-